MKIRVKRITFFVDDLDAATKYYRGTLGLGVADVREGWSSFHASRDIEIAFHRAKGRGPRIELLVEGDLRGARLGSCKKVRGREICIGKDSDGNSVQLSADSPS